MTMPHLMNCRHSEDGWCLDCVKEEHESKERRIEELEEQVLAGVMGSPSLSESAVNLHNAIDRVEAWILESESIQRMLEYSGGAVVLQACESMSLRELARRTGLSPTYLSQVKNGHATISPKAFALVSRQVQCR